MFTMEDFEHVSGDGKRRTLLDALLFSVQKSDIAYAMNLQNNHHRGTYAEKLIMRRLVQRGFDVIHYGETHDFDLLINGDIRAEVKLATAQPYGKTSTQYIFHKIKPECFDVIFFVFLNAYGLTTKWTDSNIVTKWSTNYKRGTNGYSMRFNDKMHSTKIIYDETFDGFVELFQ